MAQAGVAVARDPDEDPDVRGRVLADRAAQLLATVAGVLERVPDDLQEQPFLGVHQLGLQGRDVEEQRIEAVHVAQEGAPAAVHPALGRLLRIRIIEGVDIPAFARDLGDAIDPGRQCFPEVVQALCTRIASGESDDGDVP